MIAGNFKYGLQKFTSGSVEFFKAFGANSVWPMMEMRMLLKSREIPPASVPTGSIF